MFPIIIAAAVLRTGSLRPRLRDGSSLPLRLNLPLLLLHSLLLLLLNCALLLLNALLLLPL